MSRVQYQPLLILILIQQSQIKDEFRFCALKDKVRAILNNQLMLIFGSQGSFPGEQKEVSKFGCIHESSSKKH